MDKKMGIRLDLGAGHTCPEGFVGVDNAKYSPSIEYVVDLNLNKLPFSDNTVDEIRTSHTLEHLKDPMALIQEAHRVLKPGAKLTIIVPYGMHPFSKKPNHINYWNMHCIDYFNGEYHEYKKWSTVKFSHNWGQSKIYKPLEKIFDCLIAFSPMTYEKRFAYLFPFFELVIEVTK
jgi:predicted SAM-dependent methyltransferase